MSEADDDLGEEAVDLEIYHVADELIAAGDAAVAFAGLAGGASGVFFDEGFQGGLLDTVMAAGRLYGGQLTVEDPLFDGGVADAEDRGGFTRFEERQRFRHGQNCTGERWAGRRGRDVEDVECGASQLQVMSFTLLLHESRYTSGEADARSPEDL